MKFDTPHVNSTPSHPYALTICQHGWGVNLAAFPTKEAAIAAGEAAWNIDHDHQDFTRGGEDRAEWCVTLDRFDDEGELLDGETLWSKKADEIL